MSVLRYQVIRRKPATGAGLSTRVWRHKQYSEPSVIVTGDNAEQKMTVPSVRIGTAIVQRACPAYIQTQTPPS